MGFAQGANAPERPPKTHPFTRYALKNGLFCLYL